MVADSLAWPTRLPDTLPTSAGEAGKKMRPAFGLKGSKVTTGHICTVITPAYICFGYLNAVSSGITNRQSFVQTFPQLDTVNTTGPEDEEHSRIEGTVVALFNLGCLFSAIACIFLGDKLGRKRTVMLGLAITVIGPALQSTAYTLPHLIVGRLITGLVFGAVTATAPNWQSETTTPQLRGLIVMRQSGFLSIGLATAGWLEYGLAFAEGSVVWRLPLAFPCFLCCMAVMAGCMSQANNKAAADTAVAFIFLYVFFYVTGCIGLPYLYCSEIALLAVRTQIR
ncbi:uncharacterized protein BDW70DRAFT_165095 [Aspergillus foveolatus]|uniref:uncharacterized protein n=1 Tax=Aspergillus foveolatus TaxID=210207 RepID=UPI003CCD67F2